MTNTIDLDKLEQVARAATPGIWERNGEAVDSEDGSIYNIAVCQHARCAESWSGTDYAAKSYQLSNADFIAAANPAVLLELVRRLRAAEQDAKRYQWLRECSWYESELCVLRNPKEVLTKGSGLGADCPSHGRLDFFIDAAIAAQGASHD